MAQKDIIEKDIIDKDKDKIEIHNSSFSIRNPFNPIQKITDEETKNVLLALLQLFTINKLAYTTQPIENSTHKLEYLSLSLPLKDIHGFYLYQPSPPHFLALLKLVYIFYVDITFEDVNKDDKIQELRELIVSVKKIKLTDNADLNSKELKNILLDLDKDINKLKPYIKEIRVAKLDENENYGNVGVASISSDYDIQIIQNTIYSIANLIVNFYYLCIHDKHRISNIDENTSIPTVIGSIFWDITEYKYEFDRINNNYEIHKATKDFYNAKKDFNNTITALEKEVVNKVKEIEKTRKEQEDKIKQREVDTKQSLNNIYNLTCTSEFIKYFEKLDTDYDKQAKTGFKTFGWGLLGLISLNLVVFFCFKDNSNWWHILPINAMCIYLLTVFQLRSNDNLNISREYKDLSKKLGAVKGILDVLIPNTTKDESTSQLKDKVLLELTKDYLKPRSFLRNNKSNNNVKAGNIYTKNQD